LKSPPLEVVGKGISAIRKYFEAQGHVYQ